MIEFCNIHMHVCEYFLRDTEKQLNCRYFTCSAYETNVLKVTDRFTVFSQSYCHAVWLAIGMILSSVCLLQMMHPTA